MLYKYDCHYFDGYKPCRFKRLCDGCTAYRPVGTRIAIISLEALGAVLRSTCLLTPIRRSYPDSHITWITLSNARPLLLENSLIDRIITVSDKTLSLLHFLQFDVLFSVDKSPSAGALAEQIKAKKKFGFGLTPGGAIRPLSEEGAYQFRVGLDDHLKFFINQKPETQQITETMGLPWQRDGYILELSPQEKQKSQRLYRELSPPRGGLLGFNTGCSVLYPYKKMTIKKSIELIAMWRETFPNWRILLLGGPEDETRQKEMKQAFGEDDDVIDTPTKQGLREGIIWMSLADFVFTGCSLGLHLAIALKKYTICWFGVSCAQEIDLYGRGRKLQAAVNCSPCWRKSCDKDIKCFDQVSLDEIRNATREAVNRISKRDHEPSPHL